jgi:hypothetical protein
MFGSSVLEVAIGVAGVYAMVSLVCTATNELISSVGIWRAKTLAAGITNLLDEATAQQFYEHPLIRGLYRKGQKPSYIPSRTFALALMDLIVPAGPGRPDTIEGLRGAVDASTAVTPGLKRVLSILIEDALNTIATGRQLQAAGIIDTQKLETAINHVHENIEVWFNNAMERVAGWYKRKTQAVILALALIVTCALNVDTILIVKRLSYDSALRQALVAQAEKLAASPGQAGINDGLARLQATGLPLGWGEDRVPADQRDVVWYLTKVFGLLLTAGAASLGAPFWFDVLNKIITVRSAGKAPEESPKSPKEIPRPMAPGQSIPPAEPAPPADAAPAEK